MKLTKPGSRKVVTVTNPATVTTLQAAGWVPEGERSEPEAPVGTVNTEPGETEIPAGNASRAAWAAYAQHLGIDVAEDAKRDEIRAVVENLLGDED